MTIKQWLNQANLKLQAQAISSARLDAELILAHCLKKNRTWLIARSDHLLDSKTQQEANQLLRRRLNNEPLAYLVGYKEFFGRKFEVSPAVLIPRPESETLIELLSELVDHPGQGVAQQLLDVGCGSGCLGITAKLEYPQLEVTLSDISPEALAVARRNAEKLKANLTILESDLLTGFIDNNRRFDYIVANLPYVDPDWFMSAETAYEPQLALIARDNGLDLIKQLIKQSHPVLKTKAKLLLEADPRQHQAVINFASTAGFTMTHQRDYCLLFEKK